MKHKLPWDEIKNGIQNSIFLAAAAMFGSIPMFMFQFRHMTGGVFLAQPSLAQAYYLALSQSFILFLVAFLSALVRFLYRERLQLPKFGDLRDIARWLMIGVIAGAMLTPLFYYTCDRQVYRMIPELLHGNGQRAIATMMGSALTQEVIVRLGLFTIGIYLYQWAGFKGHPIPVIFMISLFGCIGTYLFLVKFHMTHRLLMPQWIISYATTFVLQWLYCELYLKNGFMAVLGFHFGMDVKLLLYALLVSPSPPV